MTETVNEDKLHAYVDGALDAEERRAVDAYLAAHPDEAARVRAYVAQNQMLHRLFDPVLDEPHALRVGSPARAADAARAWRRLGGIAATLALGIAIGYVARGQFGRGVAPAAPGIAQQAVLAHATYLPEVRHPVEVVAAEEQHLVGWLSKRLGASVRAPSLAAAGYQLLGGRLLPAAGEVGNAPVALFMYENAQGRRLSLLVRRESSNRDTAFRFSQSGETGVFYWIDGPFGYALAGNLDKDSLASVARLVYQQLNP
ncbi:MAG: anti-sigma factor [Pseudomonadota bacterium]